MMQRKVSNPNNGTQNVQNVCDMPVGVQNIIPGPGWDSTAARGDISSIGMAQVETGTDS